MEEQGQETQTEDSLLSDIDTAEENKMDFSQGRPENFPEEFWDEESKAPRADAMFEALQKQEKIAKDLREKMGRGLHKPPESPDGYEFTIDEKYAELVPEDDPVLVKAREVAHKNGIPKELAEAFVNEMGNEIAAMREAQAKADAEAEFGISEEEMAAQEAEYRKAELAKIPNGLQMARAVKTWADGLKESGHFTQNQYEAFQSMAQTAEQLQILNGFRAMISGKSEIPVDGLDDGLPSDAEIADMIVAASEAAKTGDMTKQKKVDDLLTKRLAAGRPAKLQF